MAARRGETAGVEAVPQRAQAGRVEPLRLELQEDVREDVEIARRAVGRVQRRVDARAQRRREDDLQHDDDDERAGVAGDAPPARPRRWQQGASAAAIQRSHSCCSAGGALGPADERIAVNAGAHVGAGQRHALAQVEGGCELDDGLATRANLRRRRRAWSATPRASPRRRGCARSTAARTASRGRTGRGRWRRDGDRRRIVRRPRPCRPSDPRCGRGRARRRESPAPRNRARG